MEYVKELTLRHRRMGYRTVVLPDGQEVGIDLFISRLLSDEEGNKAVFWKRQIDHTIHVIDMHTQDRVCELRLPDDYKLYVNAYAVTRHYGGPEEGGWWYNRSECVETRKVTPTTAETVRQQMLAKWSAKNRGDIYSVLGGVLHKIYVQREPAESQELARPHYE